jgi:hypothetical protein
MTNMNAKHTVDVAGKFLLGLFAFLAVAACVAVLGGCSSASTPSLCKPGSHEVYIPSVKGTACAVDGTANPCDNGTDCSSGCCDAVNGDINNRRCTDDVSADPNGFCVCAGGGDSACPSGDTCQADKTTGYDVCVVNEAAPDAGPTICVHSSECASGCCSPVGPVDECTNRDAGAFCLN